MDKSENKKSVQLMRQVIEPAFILLLLIRQGRLPSKVKLAAMLGLERRKVGKLVNQLIDLGFVLAVPGQTGYRLSDALSPAQQQVVQLFTRAQDDTGNGFAEFLDEDG